MVSVLKPSKKQAVLKVLLCDDSASYNLNIDMVFIVWGTRELFQHKKSDFCDGQYYETTL